MKSGTCCRQAKKHRRPSVFLLLYMVQSHQRAQAKKQGGKGRRVVCLRMTRAMKITWKISDKKQKKTGEMLSESRGKENKK